MTRVAAFLIVGTLAVLPLAQVVCATSCRPASVGESMSGCHEHAPAPTHPGIVSFHRCDDAVFWAVFLPKAVNRLSTESTLTWVLAPAPRAFHFGVLIHLGSPERFIGNSPPLPQALGTNLRI